MNINNNDNSGETQAIDDKKYDLKGLQDDSIL